MSGIKNRCFIYLFFFLSQIEQLTELNPRALARAFSLQDTNNAARIIKRYPFARRPNVPFIRTVSLIYPRDENADAFTSGAAAALQPLLCLPFVTPPFFTFLLR